MASSNINLTDICGETPSKNNFSNTFNRKWKENFNTTNVDLNGKINNKTYSS